MKIIKDLRPKTKLYKFIHPGCCEFFATGDEFIWQIGQYNEEVANIKCPLCGKQFYQSDPEKIDPTSPGIYPDGCPKDCYKCNSDCIYRKVDFMSSKIYQPDF